MRLNYFLKVQVPLILTLGVFGCAGLSKQEEKKVSAEGRARLLVELANSNLIEGEGALALKHLFEAEDLFPKLPELHHSKALVYFSKNDVPNAIRSARRAVELKPKYAEANTTLGKLLMDIGKYEEAEAALKIAADDPVYPESYKATTSLGIIAYRRNQDEKALRLFDKAAEQAPTVACVAFYYRGHIELKKNRYPQALENYQKATKNKCASFTDAQLALVTVYEKQKRFDLARKKLVEIQTRFPNTKVAEQAMQRLRYIP